MVTRRAAAYKLLVMNDDESSERSPVMVPGALPAARRATAVRRAIAAFVPSGSHVEIRALFQNRVSVNTIRQWRLGRRKMPKWARELLEIRAAPIYEIEVGVGREVSKYNLPSIRAQKEKATS